MRATEILAGQQCAILYRGDKQETLNATPTTGMPLPKQENGSSWLDTDKYLIVTSEDLNAYYRRKPSGRLYVPENDSGTHALAERAGIKFPTSASAFQYEQIVEGFGMPVAGPFVEFISWPPLSKASHQPATTSDFNLRNIRAAAVCVTKGCARRL
jgi:hypothetical protein